ncbi:hypothetical protein FACS1894186_8360 [Alphaproteobacteria bacterium]|nr:hypothetical protein FACS1894186_8360 [Alphaproteobacteria bacterium]
MVERYKGLGLTTNAQADGRVLEQFMALSRSDTQFMADAAERFSLTARGYHRIVKVARTIADLEGRESIARDHLTEALMFRRRNSSH